MKGVALAVGLLAIYSVLGALGGLLTAMVWFSSALVPLCVVAGASGGMACWALDVIIFVLDEDETLRHTLKDLD